MVCFPVFQPHYFIFYFQNTLFCREGEIFLKKNRLLLWFLHNEQNVLFCFLSPHACPKNILPFGHTSPSGHHVMPSGHHGLSYFCFLTDFQSWFLSISKCSSFSHLAFILFSVHLPPSQELLLGSNVIFGGLPTNRSFAYNLFNLSKVDFPKNHFHSLFLSYLW